MEKERLIFNINRFDGYYNGINNKCAVFLALSTFIVGGLITAYPTVLKTVNCGCWVTALMSLLIALGIAIMIVVILASTPYLNSRKISLLYFGSIAKMKAADFIHQSKSVSAEDEVNDLRNQVYDLACGLQLKFYRLRIAGWLFFAQFILFIPLLFILIINLK